MSLTSPDFESGAYTNFATPASEGHDSLLLSQRQPHVKLCDGPNFTPPSRARASVIWLTTARRIQQNSEQPMARLFQDSANHWTFLLSARSLAQPLEGDNILQNRALGPV
jgi:hypothetical protein